MPNSQAFLRSYINLDGIPLVEIQVRKAVIPEQYKCNMFVLCCWALWNRK